MIIYLYSVNYPNTSPVGHHLAQTILMLCQKVAPLAERKEKAYLAGTSTEMVIPLAGLLTTVDVYQIDLPPYL